MSSIEILGVGPDQALSERRSLAEFCVGRVTKLHGMLTVVPSLPDRKIISDAP